MSQPVNPAHTHKHTHSLRLQGTSISAGTRLHKVVMVALQPVNAVVYNPRPLLFCLSKKCSAILTVLRTGH